MSIQGALDQEALDMLQKVKAVYNNAPSFERNQMICYTLSRINDSYKPLISMNNQELSLFQEFIIRFFQHKKWIQK